MHEETVIALNKNNVPMIGIFVDESIVYRDLKSKELPCDESLQNGYGFYSQEQRGYKLNNVTHWLPLNILGEMPNK